MLTNSLNFLGRHMFAAKTLAFLLMIILIALPFFIFGNPLSTEDFPKEFKEFDYSNSTFVLGGLCVVLLIGIILALIKVRKGGVK